MDRLQAMRTFMRVLETGSFTAAASALGVRQPTVSKHVSRLEASMGVALLERSTHELSPTPAGAELYRRCETLLGALDAAEAATRSADGQPSGVLRVAAAAVLWPLLARELGALLSSSPALSIRILPSGSDADVTLTLEAQLDAVPILAGVRQVYASADWIAAHGAPDTPDALHGLPCVCTPDQERWVLGDVSVSVAARMVVPDLMAAASAARAGAGAALLPAWAAGGLEPLFPSHLGTPMPVWARYRDQRYQPPAVSALLEQLGS